MLKCDKHFLISAALSCCLLVSSQVLAANPEDPYEAFNRKVFQFNEFIDKIILKPIATLYTKIVPKPLVQGFSNFYNNINTVPTVFNDLLQANFYQALSDTWRLAISSTIGVVGFFDVASEMGLEPNKEDFGLTLARWGYKRSNYVVWPFFGPSTIRDGIGIPVDYYALSIYPHIHSWKVRYGLYGGSIIVKRADYIQFENVMQQAALDKYIFMRDAYLQRRQYQIERNDQLGNPYIEKNSKLVDDTTL